MKTNRRLLAASASLLLLGTLTLPAMALDVNLGGGGVSIGGGPSGSGASATVGGTNSNTIASVGGTTSQTGGATLQLTNNDGNLVDLGQDSGNTAGSVNLGGGLNGLDLAGLGLGGLGDGGGLLPGNGSGGGGTSAQRLNAAFAGLGSAQQQQLKLRCASVLASPAVFEPDIVALCRMIQKIGRPN